MKSTEKQSASAITTTTTPLALTICELKFIFFVSLQYVNSFDWYTEDLNSKLYQGLKCIQLLELLVVLMLWFCWFKFIVHCSPIVYVGSMFGPCFVLHNLVSFLVLYLSRWERESWFFI